MPQEVEVKLRIDNPKALLRALEKLGARRGASGSGRVHEMNVIFDTPQGGLAKHGQLLRIRTETPEAIAKKPKSVSSKTGTTRRSVLTFKKPPSDPSGALPEPGSRRHKVREEIEIDVADPAKVTQIFEGLGMKGWFRYEKYRTTYKLPSNGWAKGLLIELDETPIGTFVELEGPPDAIDRAARELGYSPRNYILKNYLVLYVEARRREGREPTDMLFSNPK